MSISLPDGTMKTVKHIGNVKLSSYLVLTNVLYIPEFRFNLLSIPKLVIQQNISVIFNRDECFFQDPLTNQTRILSNKEDGLYRYSHSSSSSSVADCTAVISSFNKTSNHVNRDVRAPALAVAHARLGHVSIHSMKHLSNCSFSGNEQKSFSCETCILAKHQKLPFNRSLSIAQHCFDLVHIDVWGPYRTPSISGALYFLTIVDDKSRVTWTHLMHDKKHVHVILSSYIAYVSTQFQVKIKVFRSDNGGEFLNQVCNELFAKHGIVHQKSDPGNPQRMEEWKESTSICWKLQEH